MKDIGSEIKSSIGQGVAWMIHENRRVSHNGDEA